MSPGAAEARRATPPGARAIGDVVARAGEACDMLGVPDGRVHLVIACSGGIDSAAALHALRRARPSAKLYACYIDHRIRPPASIARDRRAVRAQARESGALVKLLRTSGVIPKGTSVESALRAERYRLLAAFAQRVGARFVITGHQRDDVAESTVLALMRGSGVDGLAAMAPRRQLIAGVEVIRPLLWAPKRVLTEYANAAGLAVSYDETNDDVRIRRNAVRRLLRDVDAVAPGASRAIARSAAIAADDKRLLAAVARAAWRDARSDDGASLTQARLRRLPVALLRRVLRLEVQRVVGSGRDLAYAHCAAIARALLERRGGVFHAGTARAVLSGRRLKIDLAESAAPARRTQDATIIAPRARRVVDWNGGRISVWRTQRGVSAGVRSVNGRVAGRSVYLDSSAIPAGTELTLRKPKSGDRFTPQGRRSAVGLARFLAKAGLSREERRDVPLLCADGTIAAVVGVRTSAAFAARPGAPVLEVAWHLKSAGRTRSTRR